MIQTAFVSFLTASILTLSTVSATGVPQAQIELGSASMSLDHRLEVKSANEIYKDNILLNLAYLSGEVKSKQNIDWDKIRKPFVLQFSLEPGERFAYHDVILPQYQDRVAVTAHTNFGQKDGFKSDGNLYGMGVCHLASLIHWAALNAGLDSTAPTNHDFYEINEIPKEYGVAIFNSPDLPGLSAEQNLYIRNNLDSKIIFRFNFDGDNLKVTVLKS